MLLMLWPDEIGGPEQLNNALIAYTGELNLGWSAQFVDSVDERFVNLLCGVLTHIDHERL